MSTAAAPSADQGSAGAPTTLVAFHAHPDDEALLTGGTLAKAAALGHRVVVVVATAGELGLAADRAALGARRMAELERAAGILGVSRVVSLGYGDSGFREPLDPPPGSLCAAPLDEVAGRLAAVLLEERADVLTVYDARGGYGHRDHVRVHDAGVVAARHAGVPTVFAATVDRAVLLRGLRLLSRLGIRVDGTAPEAFAEAFSAPEEITHVVDVRRQVRAKRAALAAHASQAGGSADVRTVRLLSRLPWPVSRVVLGREWFVSVGDSPEMGRMAEVFTLVRR